MKDYKENMKAPIYYQSDCNLSLLEGKTIAIIGYGSQGHVRQPGSRARAEPEGIRLQRYHRSVQGQQVLGKSRGAGL